MMFVEVLIMKIYMDLDSNSLENMYLNLFRKTMATYLKAG